MLVKSKKVKSKTYLGLNDMSHCSGLLSVESQQVPTAHSAVGLNPYTAVAVTGMYLLVTIVVTYRFVY